MLHLQLKKLSFTYENSSDEILENINIDFSEGWSAILGLNGSGKSTLLKLIAKEIKPQSGSVIGSDLVYYCDQTANTLPHRYEEFTYGYNAQSFQLKNLLKIKEEWLHRWESLSYGERKRIQIAVALYCNPDILLLDEPTNHLDEKSRKTIIDTLKKYKKIGIVVTHDRELLQEICTATVFLKNSKAFFYNTSYKSALKEFEKKQSSLYKKSQQINQKIDILQNKIQKQKEKVSCTKKRFSKKNIDKKDKSEKERINLAKLTGKDKRDSKKVDNLNTKLQYFSSKQTFTDKEYQKGITIESSFQNRSFPISIKKDFCKLSEEKRLSYPDIMINKEDKIALIGENGSGKSTFIKHLVSMLKQRENVLYLPQEIDTALAQKLFCQIRELSNSKKGELFTYVSRLSSNPKALLANECPSPGELRKLLIAKALLESIDLIILDEPTNHMDLDSIISLEKSLQEYDGALFMISHDKTFLKNTCSSFFSIEKIEQEEYQLIKYI